MKKKIEWVFLYNFHKRRESCLAGSHLNLTFPYLLPLLTHMILPFGLHLFFIYSFYMYAYDMCLPNQFSVFFILFLTSTKHCLETNIFFFFFLLNKRQTFLWVNIFICLNIILIYVFIETRICLYLFQIYNKVIVVG